MKARDSSPTCYKWQGRGEEGISPFPRLPHSKQVSGPALPSPCSWGQFTCKPHKQGQLYCAAQMRDIFSSSTLMTQRQALLTTTDSEGRGRRGHFSLTIAITPHSKLITEPALLPSHTPWANSPITHKQGQFYSFSWERNGSTLEF